MFCLLATNIQVGKFLTSRSLGVLHWAKHSPQAGRVSEGLHPLEGDEPMLLVESQVFLLRVFKVNRVIVSTFINCFVRITCLRIPLPMPSFWIRGLGASSEDPQQSQIHTDGGTT